MQAMIAEVIVALEESGLPFGATKADPKKLSFYPFRHDPKEYGVFWDVRKGLIPIVGGARETGESVWLFSGLCRHVSWCLAFARGCVVMSAGCLAFARGCVVMSMGLPFAIVVVRMQTTLYSNPCLAHTHGLRLLLAEEPSRCSAVWLG